MLGAMRPEWRCRFPGCNKVGVQTHHIIFRSYSRKACLMEPWNEVRLCAEHHTGGKDAAHNSRQWREYYQTLLPKDWKERIQNCKELRLSYKQRHYG